MSKPIDIESEWKEALKEHFETKTFIALSEFVKKEYLSKKVFPEPKNIFKAFSLTPFSKVKVVILGQDPYHGVGQAHGLSFSVPPGVAVPPSLKNIYKEIESDIGTKKDFSNGNLEDWAKQGVLLLNAVLSVIAGMPASHGKRGWEEFTDTVIKTLSERHEHIVFMLWGNFARSKKVLIDEKKHLVLEAPHPSPFSANNGFFGSKHFSKCNEYLRKNHKKEIHW
jgi:uracil-DNA glycosylase